MRFLLRSLGEPRDPFVPRSVASPRVVGSDVSIFGRGREVAALLVWTLALFIGLALGSYPILNWVGPVGEAAARSLVDTLGIIAWSVPFELALIGLPFVQGRRSEATAARLAGDLLIVVVLAALVQVAVPDHVAFGGRPGAGLIGELFGELARSLFSTVGSFLVGFACLGLVLIGRASFSFIALVRLFVAIASRLCAFALAAAHTMGTAWRKARELDRDPSPEPHIELTPAVTGATGQVVGLVPSDEAPPVDCDVAEVLAPARRRRRAAEGPLGNPPTPPKRRRRGKVDASEGESPPLPDATSSLPAVALPTTPPRLEFGNLPEPDLSATPSPPATPAAPHDLDRGVPTIVDTSAALAPELDKVVVVRPEPPRAHDAPAPRAAFRLPELEWLAAAKSDSKMDVDKDVLLANADLLVKTLADYGVSGRVEDILPGPTVTTFEVSPAAGTKVSKVASLADDLALALAKKVRIVAPIPGENRIGFELPNERRVAVNLRDLVEDRRFQSLDVPLPVVMGRDIVGNPVYADLASMPHVIVAGATGAGKSVGLNVMLTSLLYRREPSDLRLLMIDPKVVELAPFDRIPHMLLPVVTDMKQAATALKWAVNEMERRYQSFADAGTKNITTYNAWVARMLARDKKPDPLPERLPWIVIVVDEFADLMMQQGKEVETSVARLAQKARAAGMHVILATQRPSVDVITGMIKANFPTRIAFRVAQKVDSRTILDEQGAEHLLGSGDMLVKLNGTNETRRVQCPWVSEGEVQQVCDHLRSQGEPIYDDNILRPTDDDEAPPEEDAEQDPMYDDAVRIVADTRRCSTSWLQRKLGLGYNRAARIVESMERRGLVGPANGAKDREVLISTL